MTQCPGETTLSDLLAGLLPEEQRAEVLAHVERCASCQRVLAVGDSASPEEASPDVAATPLARGATLARYVVLERIGAGAMGVVYAAYDPELDRQVALKVLRPAGRGVEELRLRLLQEAQSLARLSHAHVVAVHDVGTYGSGVFLAMELVDGTTLAEWLRQPHTWEEVLRVFREAGQGLAAAHAAGLVHRDFKPANVLVGRDGRARVTDFGMARPLNREASARTAASREPGGVDASPLTRTGVLLGTPAYMAPELLEGQRADARSDQFSFCVALYEALHGMRPFEGDSLEALAQAAREGRVRPAGREVRVPDWVRRAVLRGLRARPEERFPSMEALLAALVPAPRRLRARVAAAVGAAALLGAAGAYGVAHRNEARCAREVEKLAVAWGPEQRGRVHAAFLATGAPFAAVAWEKTSAALDAYAAQWRELRAEACVAAGSSPTSTGWQTTACLDTRLWQLASVTEVLERADARTVQHAQQLAASLEGLSGCRDAPALSTSPQPPDALRPQVDAARRKLVDAQAQLTAGRYAEGLKRTSALLEEVRTLDYRPLEAEVLLTHGHLQAQDGRPKDAEDLLYKALWAAEAGRDDETAARAWNLLLWVVGDQLARPADAERIARHAEAAVDRLGRERFPGLAADLHLRLTAVLLQQGKYQQADAEAVRGLELARRAHGPECLRTAHFLHGLGRVRYRQRRLEEAVTLHRQALEMSEHILGPNHPELAAFLNGLAANLERQGHTEEAIAALRRAIALQQSAGATDQPAAGFPLVTLASLLESRGELAESRGHLERALALFERSYGADHPQTAITLANLGRLASEEDRLDDALGLFQRSLERFQRSLGADTPRRATVLLLRSNAFVRAGRYAEARRDSMEALAVLEKAHGPDSVNAAMALGLLSDVDLASGAPRQALAHCQRALRIHERLQGGPDSMAVAKYRTCIAEAHLGLGAPDKALPLLEEARERFGTTSLEARNHAQASLLLARALVARRPPDRARAEALAEEARRSLEPLGVLGRPELEKVRAFQRREGLR
ncbi:tetratricopeptide repeat protein [Pyxidicoccus xibeiensis]|uniref:tetratricopeptide repeat protein n=1 Tax=Pyxidicoccus xibeiensis TaxID=2906759 RepID=UPI0020A6E6D1|nr:tetratricopeptide repeat protein [Pyxidicoccus xibeiensis]MCP3137770.1 tetratricopeptide repeat protein [Pyxidicoccus xibeiensis]